MTQQAFAFQPERQRPARTRARRTDPHTSHRAAESVAPTLTPVQHAVHQCIGLYGPQADHQWMARYKLARATMEWPAASDSSLRTRRAELVALGRLRADLDHKALTPSGREAIVWRVS